MRHMFAVCICLLVISSSTPRCWGNPEDYFGIRVVDEDTGRGVPLVELKTVNGVRFYTDSNGLVAFLEPGLMNQKVYFHIRSHGYEYPPDGFGFRGQSLQTTAGTIAEVKMRRVNLAERLYRITGEGIYHDSVLLGHEVPLAHPVNNASVLGSDSVLCTPFQGKLYWFWGDTQLANYPLGLFHTPGATSPLPGNTPVPTSKGIQLTYFTDAAGTAVNTAEIPGDGPTWLGGLTVLHEPDGTERMFAGYSKIKPPLEAYERGIVEFNSEINRFEHRITFPLSGTPFPEGHPVRQQEPDGEFVYFARPFPNVRVRASIQDFLNPASYETFTCLSAASTPRQLDVERDSSGSPVWKWKKETFPLNWQIEKQLEESGQVAPEDFPFRLRNPVDEKKVIAHGGSITWNEYRQRYVMIALESEGTSLLGEIWYAESKDLMGPWRNACKIVTHDNQSFYNPVQHPELAEEGGRFIYFEGTYTNSFTGNPDSTPRYEYNQIMYKLDLSDERLRTVRQGGPQVENTPAEAPN